MLPTRRHRAGESGSRDAWYLGVVAGNAVNTVHGRNVVIDANY